MSVMASVCVYYIYYLIFYTLIYQVLLWGGGGGGGGEKGREDLESPFFHQGQGSTNVATMSRSSY